MLFTQRLLLRHWKWVSWLFRAYDRYETRLLGESHSQLSAKELSIKTNLRDLCLSYCGNSDGLMHQPKKSEMFALIKTRRTEDLVTSI